MNFFQNDRHLIQRYSVNFGTLQHYLYIDDRIPVTITAQIYSDIVQPKRRIRPVIFIITVNSFPIYLIFADLHFYVRFSVRKLTQACKTGKLKIQRQTFHLQSVVRLDLIGKISGTCIHYTAPDFCRNQCIRYISRPFVFHNTVPVCQSFKRTDRSALRPIVFHIYSRHFTLIGIDLYIIKTKSHLR